MTDAKTPVWLVALINKALGEGLSQRELAAIMGVKQPNISKYLARQQEPSINVVERLIRHMGGDIMRAMPGYSMAGAEPPPVIMESSGPPVVRIEGELDGGEMNLGSLSRLVSGQKVELRLIVGGTCTVSRSEAA